MPHPAIPAALLLATLLWSAAAHGRYEPVVSDDILRLSAKKARLYVERPCKVRPVGEGERFRVVPGDVLRAAGPRMRGKRVITNSIMATFKKQKVRVRLKCLSRRPLDYSFRKGKFSALCKGLVKDLVRQMDQYLTIARKYDFDVHSSDPKTNKRNPDWERYQALRKHLSWVRGRYFAMAYRGPGERSVLKKDGDWITARGEQFIKAYSGGAPEEVKEHLKKVYKTLNRLSNVPYHVGAIGRLQQKIRDQKGGDKYKELSPAHRARLQSEDTIKLQTQMAQRRTKIGTIMADVRARLMTLGIKVR